MFQFFFKSANITATAAYFHTTSDVCTVKKKKKFVQ